MPRSPQKKIKEPITSIEKIVPRSQTLKELEEEIHQCEPCLNLYKGWHNVVFGVGNPRADIVFVGEAPGADEDLKGEPFVGRAGKLLNKVLAEAGLTREDVYITNVVKIRPPENRTPTPAEMELYRPFLIRQLEIIAPKVIICLGKTASQGVLQSDVPITKLRGEFMSFGKAKVMPAFHPAYILRNPPMRKFLVEDVKKAAVHVGIKPPSQEHQASF